MSIKYAILGFLSWKPLTGYDLKKLFAESDTFHWSGNSNQVYRTLVELHRENLVTQQVEYQENHPPRKVYTITAPGQAELKQWVRSTPDLPQLRNPFWIQLAWADPLDDGELDALLSAYEDELDARVIMLREQARRDSLSPGRTPRESYLWSMIADSQISFYERERAWTRQLREELARDRIRP